MVEKTVVFRIDTELEMVDIDREQTTPNLSVQESVILAAFIMKCLLENAPSRTFKVEILDTFFQYLEAMDFAREISEP